MRINSVARRSFAFSIAQTYSMLKWPKYKMILLEASFLLLTYIKYIRQLTTINKQKFEQKLDPQKLEAGEDKIIFSTFF